MRAIDQGNAFDLWRILGRINACQDCAPGMTGHHIGRTDIGLCQQGVEFTRQRERIAWISRRLAPAHTGSIESAHSHICGELILNPIPPGGIGSPAGLKNDRRITFAFTDDVHQVTIDGIQLTGRRIVLLVQCDSD